MFKSKNNKWWWGCCETRALMHCWWECKWVQPLWKTVWRLLKKLKVELSYDPVIPLLDTYPKEHRSGYNRDTCTDVYCSTFHNSQAIVDALQLMNGSRKCTCTRTWTHTHPPPHTMEFYSVLRKNYTMWLKVNGCNWRTSC
jgi:hypothetical protein